MLSFLRRLWYKCFYPEPYVTIQVRCTAKQHVLYALFHHFKYEYPANFTRWCLVFSIGAHGHKDTNIEIANQFVENIQAFVSSLRSADETPEKIDVCLMECFQFETIRQAIEYNKSVLDNEGTQLVE
jgi:hypothetical protein